MDFSSIPQFLAGGLAIGAVYGLVGAGFSLIYNTSKVINFAQGEFVVVGGLVVVSLVSFAVPVWLAMPLGLLVCMGLGGMLQAILRLATKGSTELTYIMVTIGVAMAMTGLAHQIWGTDYLTFPLYPERGFKILGASVGVGTLSILAVTSIVCLIMWWILYRTLIGKAMRACANDPRAAQTLGIRPQTMVLFAYLVSAFLGGLAGVLVTPSTMMSYDNGVLLAIKGFAAAVVGGLINPFGAIVGGLLVGLIEGLSVGLFASDLQNAYAFLTLLLVLAFRPQGLFGKAAQGTAR